MKTDFTGIAIQCRTEKLMRLVALRLRKAGYQAQGYEPHKAEKMPYLIAWEDSKTFGNYLRATALLSGKKIVSFYDYYYPNREQYKKPKKTTKREYDNTMLTLEYCIAKVRLIYPDALASIDDAGRWYIHSNGTTLGTSRNREASAWRSAYKYIYQ